MTDKPLPRDFDVATSSRELVSLEAVEAVTDELVIVQMLSSTRESSARKIGEF